jgi:predicted nucleic acid-binding protein
MVVTGDWLIDKSAYVRLLRRPQGSDEWLDRINRGLVHVSTVTLLEIGYSARNSETWSEEMALPPISNVVPEYLTPRAEERAVDVQGMLAERGHHRAPGVADLLIAATAETAGLTVLHMDKDFELIAEVTGQELARLETEI